MTTDFKLAAFLPYQLAVLSERTSRRLAVEYEQSHGLSVAEWRVLVHLQDSGAGSVRDITRRVNLDKPRVSRAVTRLEAAGMVAKQVGAGDARLVSITLTPAGAAALAAIIPAAREVEARLLNALSADEKAALATIMEKLHGVLDTDPQARPRVTDDPVRASR